jgi:RNase H-fold protein (predicted Holliday junction resolvase)
MYRLRARGELEDRLENLGIDPMRTRIEDPELEEATKRLKEERFRKVVVGKPIPMNQCIG